LGIGLQIKDILSYNIPMQNVIMILQIITSFVIISCVLLQSQGTGLGSTWGGGGESYHTKRGVERVLLFLTVGFVILFAIISIISVFVRS
jgi:protein translocase SecG subunit